MRLARQPATHALTDTGVHLFNAGAFIIISRTSVNHRIPQTAHPSWNKNSAIAGWRTRTECRNRAAAIRMQKTDLIKVGFQAVICNATNATHAMYAREKRNARNVCTWKTQCMQCMHVKNAMHAMYAHEKRNACNVCIWKTQRTQRIELIACFVFLRACIVYFGFWLRRKPCVRCVASVALRVLRTTTWKPHVGLWKRT